MYEAEEVASGELVALKVLKAHEAAEGSARFWREARLVAQLQHPHIVRVLDMGASPEQPFLAMELLDGITLEDHLRSKRRLSPAATIELMVPVMGAVAFAHGQNVLHRDLKPANIFLCATADGKWLPKLLDFGIAREVNDRSITRTGTTVGTPAYMAPEQALAEPPAPSMDIWALGAVLYHCLSGQLPFDGDSATSLLVQAATKPAPGLADVAPFVPAAVCAVVDRALRRQPDRRYDSVGQFVRMLGEAAACEELALPEDPEPVGLPHWRQWQRERSTKDTTPVSTVRSKAPQRVADAGGTRPARVQLPTMTRRESARRATNGAPGEAGRRWQHEGILHDSTTWPIVTIRLPATGSDEAWASFLQYMEETIDPTWRQQHHCQGQSSTIVDLRGVTQNNAKQRREWDAVIARNADAIATFSAGTAVVLDSRVGRFIYAAATWLERARNDNSPPSAAFANVESAKRWCWERLRDREPPRRSALAR